ncbi:MAG: aminotransferase class III-fold pyridoxal phosphate-dependent enzyme, partial [Proteobacteria bacterium]|nr:aminotransferase class III-fold pyridoxal phosphate-dependent enzyme [Pseudomonadota bacterium]
MGIQKSLSMQQRAKGCIPGVTQLLSKRPDQFSQGVWPGYFSRCQGAYVWDLDGNRYLDMSISAIGAAVLGYADPDVDGAVRVAIGNGVACSLNCPEEVELAELLCELHPWAQMARFTRSGGEAMTLAVRLARAATGRDLIAFCGYHGWHDWYLASNLSKDDALDGHLLPGLEPAGVPRSLAGTALPFSYNRLEELESIVVTRGRELGVIVMEPLRNFEPEPGFIEGVRRFADQTGAVLIMDEISAGFRFTTGGAHLVKCSVEPDVAVFSKALGNGYAIAAVIGRETVMQAAQKSFISSTNWTERIGPVAALATVRKHRELGVAVRLNELGGAVQAGWKRAAKEAGLAVHVGGSLPLSHFTFEDGDHAAMKALFVQEMVERGFLASNIYYAMHAHTDEHVQSYLEATGQVFAEIASAHAAGEVENCLKGAPAAAGFK